MGLIPSPMQWVKGSSIVAAVDVVKVTAAVQIQSLAWGLPYAVGSTIKKKRKKKSKVEQLEANSFPHSNVWKKVFVMFI